MAGEALLTRSSNRWRVATSEAAIQDSPAAAGRRLCVARGNLSPKRHALKVRFNVWRRSLSTVTRDIRIPTVPIEPRFQR